MVDPKQDTNNDNQGQSSSSQGSSSIPSTDWPLIDTSSSSTLQKGEELGNIETKDSRRNLDQ